MHPPLRATGHQKMVHLSGVVGGIATVPALAAFAFRRSLPVSASILLWHIAGAGLAVSAAASERLARHSTAMLGKRRDGTISPLGMLAFWPYHVSLRAKLAIQRRLSEEPAWDQITDTYFLGAWPSEEALVPTVHPAVLDVTCELPLQVTPPAYKLVPVWDTHSELMQPPCCNSTPPACIVHKSLHPLPPHKVPCFSLRAGPQLAQIDDGVRWVQEQVKAGRKVLIHCAHGHGRSATMLGAVLVAEGHAATAEEAEALMKAKRPRVRLNPRQKLALKQWIAGRGKLQ